MTIALSQAETYMPLNVQGDELADPCVSLSFHLWAVQSGCRALSLSLDLSTEIQRALEGDATRDESSLLLYIPYEYNMCTTCTPASKRNMQQTEREHRDARPAATPHHVYRVYCRQVD